MSRCLSGDPYATNCITRIQDLHLIVRLSRKKPIDLCNILQKEEHMFPSLGDPPEWRLHDHLAHSEDPALADPNLHDVVVLEARSRAASLPIPHREVHFRAWSEPIDT